MKMVLGFLIGASTVFLAMFSVRFFLPLQASEDPEAPSGLIPDIAKINREALVTPLREAEKTIWDKDVAAYYHLLLERTRVLRDESPTPE